MYQFILHLCMHVCTFSAYGSELIFTAAIETTVQLSQNKTSRFLVHEIALVSHSFGFTQLSTIHLQLGVAISCFFMQMQHVGYLCQEMKTGLLLLMETTLLLSALDWWRSMFLTSPSWVPFCTTTATLTALIGDTEDGT